MLGAVDDAARRLLATGLSRVARWQAVTPIRSNGPARRFMLKNMAKRMEGETERRPRREPQNRGNNHCQRATGPTMFEVDIGRVRCDLQGTGRPDRMGGTEDEVARNRDQFDPNLGPILTKDNKKLFFWDLNQGGPVKLNYGLNFEPMGRPSTRSSIMAAANLGILALGDLATRRRLEPA